jgi:hypothetical protein
MRSGPGVVSPRPLRVLAFGSRTSAYRSYITPLAIDCDGVGFVVGIDVREEGAHVAHEGAS